MKKSGITAACLAFLICSLTFSAACDNGKQPDDGGDDIAATVTRTESKLLENTVCETPVYTYETDKEGPRVAIVGGIHGDEVAGWNAGLQLVDTIEGLPGVCGSILLIPQANIVADTRVERYPGRSSAVSGVATVDGVKYSDLNRSFPDGRAANATEATIGISDAIRFAVEAFNADFIIDLHESRRSWTEQDVTSTSLGDTLIFKNEPLFMDDLIYYYNSSYKMADDTEFTSNPACVKGSFNYYFSNLYSNKVVFTIETTRGYVSGKGDTEPLEKRVRQQLGILNALFDIIWERV